MASDPEPAGDLTSEIRHSLGAPPIQRSLLNGWESVIPNQPDVETSTKMGAPGLDFETRDSKNQNLAPGLYLVATPIGNLGDITLRALDVLRGVDKIACEDTRQTQKLLNHFQIATPTISCHQHNERQRAEELVAALKTGSRIAVVSDAGTPGISDPGGRLVTEAIAAGVPVIPIPGANAAIGALIASGLPTEEFSFLGFLPEKAGARRTRLEELAAERRAAQHPSARTLIFYEAPHRILDTLADVASTWGPETRIAIARELTKLHEEFLRGTVNEVRRELAARDRIRGEFTLLIESSQRSQSAFAAEPGREKLSTRVARLQTEAGINEKEALKRLARELGQSKSDLYRELQRERARLR